MLLWALWAQLEPRLANKLQKKRKIKEFLRKHNKGFTQLLQQIGAERQCFLRPLLLVPHRYRHPIQLLEWLSSKFSPLFRQFFGNKTPIQGTKAWRKLWEQMPALSSQAKPKVQLYPKFSAELAFRWPNWKEQIERQLAPSIHTSAEISPLTHIEARFFQQRQQAQRIAQLKQQLQQFQQHCAHNQHQISALQQYQPNKTALFSLARKFLKEHLPSFFKSPRIFMACKMFFHSWRGAQNWKPGFWWLGVKACGHLVHRLSGGLYRYFTYSLYAAMQLLWQSAAHWQSQNRQRQQRAARRTEERLYQKEQRRRYKKAVQEQRREYKAVRSAAKKEQKQLATQAAQQRRELSAAIRREAKQERCAARLALIAEATQRLRERNFQQQNALLERQKARRAAIELRHAKLQQLRLQRQKQFVAIWTLYRKSMQSAAFVRNRLVDFGHFITQNQNRSLRSFYRRNRRMLIPSASIAAVVTIFALFIPKALYTDALGSIHFARKQFQNWAAQLFIQGNESNLAENAAPNVPSQQPPTTNEATPENRETPIQQPSSQIQNEPIQNNSVPNTNQQSDESVSTEPESEQVATEPSPANEPTTQSESVTLETPPPPSNISPKQTPNPQQNTNPNAAGSSFTPAQQQEASSSVQTESNDDNNEELNEQPNNGQSETPQETTDQNVEVPDNPVVESAPLDNSQAETPDDPEAEPNQPQESPNSEDKEIDPKQDEAIADGKNEEEKIAEDKPPAAAEGTSDNAKVEANDQQAENEVNQTDEITPETNDQQAEPQEAENPAPN